MSTVQLFAITLAAMLASVIRAGWSHYQTWKHDPDRSKIAHRNWRGVYVPDLYLDRAERGGLAVWIGVTLVAAIVGVVLILPPDAIAALFG